MVLQNTIIQNMTIEYMVISKDGDTTYSSGDTTLG